MTENLAEQLALLPEYFRGHLALTLISLIIGITISIPLGVWAAQAPRVKRPLLTLVSIIQTFPSVAILALVVAMLGGRIGSLPAIIALVLYSMLPIVRNTVTGLENVVDRHASPGCDAERAALMELVLEGLHQGSLLSRDDLDQGRVYGDMLAQMAESLR